MGARSQVSGLLAAGVVALVLLFLTGPIADLPKAVLGAVIVAACVGLVDPAAWRALWRADRVELAIAAITTAGVVIAGVLPAIGFAVALSIVDVVRRSARPHDAVLGWVPRLGRWADVSVHPSARVTPGVVVYRLDDRLFFANAGYVKGRVREALRAAPSPAARARVRRRRAHARRHRRARRARRPRDRRSASTCTSRARRRRCASGRALSRSAPSASTRRSARRSRPSPARMRRRHPAAT